MNDEQAQRYEDALRDTLVRVLRVDGGMIDPGVVGRTVDSIVSESKRSAWLGAQLLLAREGEHAKTIEGQAVSPESRVAMERNLQRHQRLLDQALVELCERAGSVLTLPLPLSQYIEQQQAAGRWAEIMERWA